jgi:putative MATE family efflux protein
MKQTDKFGAAPLGKLLREQALPASIGILTMSIYGIIDTIFVGRFVGANAIGAITVVLPITFLIASVGMAIGVGGASVLSRAIGDGNREKAYFTFGNQVILTIVFSLLFVLFGYLFQAPIISLFGGHGDIHNPAEEYFRIVLIGIPFLAWSMMSNNVIRAEGYPRVAMIVMIIPAVINLILDPIFIIWLDWGLDGAAWATTISYVAAAGFTFFHFKSKRSQMPLNWHYCKFKMSISKEIIGLGSVTLARQGVISVLATVLNNSLFYYGGEMAISAYGIISRVMMFAYFPILGITQGFIPIVGYNFGARNETRVRGIVQISISWATSLALIIFVVLMVFASEIAGFFTKNTTLILETAPAFRTVFLATPLLAVSLIISAYFQAIGKALPALLLALTKQGFFLIPLVLILPLYFGIDGIWMAFPIADIGAALVSYIYYKFNKAKYPDGKSYNNPDVVDIIG